MQRSHATTRPPVQPRLTIHGLTALGLFIAFSMLAFGGLQLYMARQDAWQQAQQAASNLVLALERDIGRNIAVYDLSLQGAIEALALPGLDLVDPKLRQKAVFGRAASANFLGSLLALDAAGNITADSTSVVPHRINFADRDYFSIHRDRPDAGLFVSRPYSSRLRAGDRSIAISRRLSGADGEFRGVVIGALRLAYFNDLFSKLDVGPHGSVTLFRSDGRVVMRRPFNDADIDRDLGDTPSFRGYRAASAGSFIGTAAIDGVQRLYTYRHIGDLPLVLSVSFAVEDIYAAWWHKAIGIGLVLTVLSGTAAALCLLFRREILRRFAAETALLAAARQLEITASTDALTGLANRRSFDARLQHEWKRAIRAEMPIALLMIDVDCFKLFNDRYGHPEGDGVLQGIGRCIQQNVFRSDDMPARYGGEEFVALLPETEEGGAVAVAERIRAAVAGLALPHADNPAGCVSVSVGIAVEYPASGDAEAALVKRADEALYEAKRSGRNRVSIATPPPSPPAVLAAVPGS